MQREAVVGATTRERLVIGEDGRKLRGSEKCLAKKPKRKSSDSLIALAMHDVQDNDQNSENQHEHEKERLSHFLLWCIAIHSVLAVAVTTLPLGKLREGYSTYSPSLGEVNRNCQDRGSRGSPSPFSSMADIDSPEGLCKLIETRAQFPAR
jgi:hypothetical protein